MANDQEGAGSTPSQPQQTDTGAPTTTDPAKQQSAIGGGTGNGGDQAQSGPGPGEKPVTPIGIVVLLVVEVALAALVLYGLVIFWPQQTPGPDGVENLTLLGLPLKVCLEVRYFILVILSGTLGGLIRSLRSLSWYVGNRNLRKSWIPMYVLNPVIGACLAMISYVVAKGGLATMTASSPTPTSPFGFVALAGLAGMFSEEVAGNLKSVATSVFTRAQQGADHTKPGTTSGS